MSTVSQAVEMPLMPPGRVTPLGPAAPPTLETALAPLSDYLRGELSAIGQPEAVSFVQRWIAACALYPRLRWPVSLLIGARLAEREGRAAPDELLHLVVGRLQWFRDGQMPFETRLLLAASLPAQDRRTARAALMEFIDHALVEARAPRLRARGPRLGGELAALCEIGGPGAVHADPILVLTLRGRSITPGNLAMARFRIAYQNSWGVYAARFLRTFLALPLAVLLTAWLWTRVGPQPRAATKALTSAPTIAPTGGTPASTNPGPGANTPPPVEASPRPKAATPPVDDSAPAPAPVPPVPSPSIADETASGEAALKTEIYKFTPDKGATMADPDLRRFLQEIPLLYGDELVRIEITFNSQVSGRLISDVRLALARAGIVFDKIKFTALDNEKSASPRLVAGDLRIGIVTRNRAPAP